MRKRERDVKLGILAPREVAYTIDGGKFVLNNRISKVEYGKLGQISMKKQKKQII